MLRALWWPSGGVLFLMSVVPLYLSAVEVGYVDANALRPAQRHLGVFYRESQPLHRLDVLRTWVLFVCQNILGDI